MERVIPTLDEAEAAAWAALVEAVGRGKHAFHTAAVATLGLDGGPRCRTVVLRGADRDRRELWFHTDARSPKFAELSARAEATLLFYDAGAKLQVRAECGVVLHCGDEVARRRWEESRETSRWCYAAEHGSSERVTAPPLSPRTDSGGFTRFACAACRVRRLEWLHLRSDGHVRAEFVYDETGARVDAGWLAP